MTPDEYVKAGKESWLKNPVAWVHGLDLMEHILQADPKQVTMETDLNDINHRQIETMRDSMSERSEKHEEEFKQLTENSYMPKKRYTTQKSDSGEFCLDSFLNGEEQVFEDPVKILSQGRAVTILYDVGVTWYERSQNFMEERHKKVYTITAEMMSVNRPVRVIAVLGEECCDIPKPSVIFAVIKEFSDPIFPGIWGCFTNNKSTNAWVNCVQDYFVGTEDIGNGRPCIVNCRQYFPDDELIMYGKRLEE